MHQLANSVIILDEVQTIPINMIHLLNVALRFLVDDCGATAVLCTATQPPLDQVGTQYHDLTIPPDRRIIPDEHALFQQLRRVEVFDERRVGGWRVEDVAELAERQLGEKGSVLAVVNTKKSAPRFMAQSKTGGSRRRGSIISAQACVLLTGWMSYAKYKRGSSARNRLFALAHS